MNLLTPEFFRKPCYSMGREAKQTLLLSSLSKLTELHQQRCPEYSRLLSAFEKSVCVKNLSDFLALPVRLFKTQELRSIPREQIFKVLTSSGTTSQQVSRIYLDVETSRYQIHALTAILQDFLGKKRRPMLIIDHSGVVKNRSEFSARGAGILGVSNFGRDHTYILNDEMQLDLSLLKEFLKNHLGKPLLIFGFTFMIWRYFYQAIEQIDLEVDLSQAYLIHSGGWKKMEDQSVDNESFKSALRKRTGIKDISNFYGMVEQVGSIFMECEKGHLHAPMFSDVLIRDPETWGVQEHGELGVIEVLSVLPQSYPGHVLLTEDMGRVIGEDDCSCGRLGKYFEIKGRIQMAETRGCSDTHTGSEASL